MPGKRQLRSSRRIYVALTVAGICLSTPLVIDQALGVLVGQPRLEVSSPGLDFGSLDPGAQATRSVELKNSGRGTLVIHKVHASCACTAIKLDRHSLGPQEATALRVTMKGKAGGANAELRILSNDPAHALTSVSITSIDGRSVVAEPAFVEFRGRGGKVSALPVVVRLVYRDSQELVRRGIPRIRATSAAIEVKQPVQHDSRSLTFSVGVNQPALRGMLRGTVIVEDSAGEAMQIPVTVCTPSTYFLPIASVVMDSRQPQTTCVLKLQRRAGAAHPPKVTFRTDAERWTVLKHSAVECRDCATYDLELTLSANAHHVPAADTPVSPADHLIVDEFDETGQLLESIWVPLSDSAGSPRTL